MQYYSLVGKAIQLQRGDELQALPGKESSKDKTEYYKAADRGRISEYDPMKDSFSITWYRTGKTSTMLKTAWMQYYSLVGKAIQLQRGDELQALPGKESSKDKTEYYKAADRGRISEYDPMKDSFSIT